MSFFSRLRAPIYKSEGSIARDHLASERTFLAWLRTGLGLVALGIAVERFTKLEPVIATLVDNAHAAPTTAVSSKQPAGKSNEQFFVGALLSTGGGSIVYGSARYFSNLRMLERGLFRPAYLGAGGLGVAVAGLAGAAIWGSLDS